MGTIRPILKETYEYMFENKEEVNKIIRGLIVTTRVFNEDFSLGKSNNLNTIEYAGPVHGEESELERMAKSGDKQGIVMFNLEKRGIISAGYFDDGRGIDTYTMDKDLALALVPSRINENEKSDYRLDPISNHKEENPIYEKLVQSIDSRSFNESTELTQIDEMIATRYGIKLALQGKEIDTDELRVQKVKIEDIEMKGDTADIKTNISSIGFERDYIVNEGIKAGDEVIVVSTKFNYKRKIKELYKV